MQDCDENSQSKILTIYIINLITTGREGNIQLSDNGISPDQGTVEYCRDGFWRVVCDVNWNYQNSFVVCRQLGLPATGIKYAYIAEKFVLRENFHLFVSCSHEQNIFFILCQ